MTKQSFPIPEGCKAVTVEQVGNQIVTTFEPEFKRGDVLISKWGNICVLDEIINENQAVEIIGLIEGRITYTENPMYFDYTQSLRLATPEEAQRLWDALAKEGKRWNPETMQVEDVKKEIPRAKVGSVYYSVDLGNRIKPFYYSEEVNDEIDKRNHETGNYFLTEEQAQRAAEKIKQALDDFWKEELK